MSGLKISIVMIVQDEEECIERALSTVHDYDIVDEIVIVDGGSTDRTKEIAAQFEKVQIHSIPFKPTAGDRFDVQRNHSIELAHNAWILVMDADEEYDADLMNALSWLMQPEAIGLPRNADAYAFSRRTFIDGRLVNINNMDWQTRFFKHYCRYNGLMHEGVTGFSHWTTCNLHIRHAKTSAWQQKDNERVWDMGQKPSEGWVKLDGTWQYNPEGV
jgi:glycosyltransferase involved in cell wall biosynthesis